MKPRIFVGSSKEALHIAYAVQENLQDDAYVTVWPQDVFKPSRSSLESLLIELDKYDFGVFVFSPDDEVKIRDSAHVAVRDNVVFELGFFISRLSKERCFILSPDVDMHVATDLIGLTPLKYDANPPDDNWMAALGPACNQIRKASRELGLSKYVSASQRAYRLFMEAFRLDRKRGALSVFGGTLYGQSSMAGFRHPDNQAAYKALKRTLVETNEFKEDQINRLDSIKGVTGDVIILGGPNSTKETQVAFEFTGSAENAELRRPEDDGHIPDLELAYYGTSDWRIGEKFWPGEWVARTRESGGTGVANWAVRRVFSDNDKFLRLAPGDDMLSVPEDMRPKVGKPNAPVIRTDYLVVTRIPNFLSVNFSNQVNSDAKKLPYLLIFDGLTGLHTLVLKAAINVLQAEFEAS